jgi:2-polyprenyl-6-hydroxyphenyl methylase / 3-demethylubiquinone-9 3-methyltransferase
MDRLRYPADHWARRTPTEEHLAEYLRLGNAYNLTKVRKFERLFGSSLVGKQVLDYGGGAGYMAVLCAGRGAQVTLVDAESTALETARLLASRRGVADRIRTICSETFPAELARERFDLVILKDVVEHIPDDKELLRKLASVQEPGGRLLLSTHSRWSLTFLLEAGYRRWWQGDKNWFGWDPTHLRFYSPPALRRLLSEAGYEARNWSAVYLVPYDILSWLLLGRRRIEIEALHRVDLWWGNHFPFNRLGWNLIVEGLRRAA